MKSLVMNGNGCTVIDSNGQLIYRVDNYDYKSSNEVYLMDRYGKTLTQIHRKKFSLFGKWEGYRCDGLTSEGLKPCFQVQKKFQILNRDQTYEHRVIVGYESVNPIYYRIILGCSAKKTEYKITNMAGEVMAQVKRKRTASGVSLGRDVLMLVIEPNVRGFQHDGSLQLQARSQKYGKLERGQMLTVPAYLVKRRKQHFHHLENYGVDMIVGCNGFIWIGEHTELKENDTMVEDENNQNEQHVTPLETRQNICRIANAIRLLSALGFTLSVEVISETVEASVSSNVAIKDMLGAEFCVQAAERQVQRKLSKRKS